MATSEITTLAVVLSPTPFAPPVVVCPHPHDIVAITPPNAKPFTHITPMSDVSKYFAAESTMALGEIPYRRSARSMLAAMPIVKLTTDRIGSDNAHATTLGATR
eukprot:30060-Pelagococcus_subviridis.AAC.3